MKTKKHTPKQQTQCNICAKIIIGSLYKFKCHLYRHKAVEARHKCSHCEKEFFRRDEYVKHIVIHDSVKRNAKKCHICDYCDRGFVDKRNLISHLKVHDDFVRAKQYKCVACGVVYCEERLLKRHIRTQHFNLNATPPILHEKQPNETWVERVKHSEIYVEITKVDNNVITIRKSPIVKKSLVEAEKSQSDAQISLALMTSSESQYSEAICNYCNKKMLKKSLLTHIREKHLNQRKFQCGKCKVSFNRHYQLVNHVCGKTRHYKVKQ